MIPEVDKKEFNMDRDLPEAEKIEAEENRNRLPKEEWERFSAKLDEPPKDLPELRRLMQERSFFVKG